MDFQVYEWTNSQWNIFDKSGVFLYQPRALKTKWKEETSGIHNWGIREELMSPRQSNGKQAREKPLLSWNIAPASLICTASGMSSVTAATILRSSDLGKKSFRTQGCWYLVVEWFRDYDSQKGLLVFDKASITKLQSFWGGGSMNVFLQAKHRHNRQVPNSHSPRDECKWPSLQAMEIAHKERVWGLQGWYFGSYGRTTPPQRLHRPHPCKTGDGSAQTKPLRKSNYFLQPPTSIDVSHS